MDLPFDLKNAIENELDGLKSSELVSVSKIITDKYGSDSACGNKKLSRSIETKVYAAVRMPATFGAVSSCLEYITDIMPDFSPGTMLDIGAGTGAGTWAAYQMFNLEQITCLEREDEMRVLGSHLMECDSELSKCTEWIKKDVILDNFDKKADFVLSSYMLNEIPENALLKVVDKLVEATNDTLLIVEPGTVKGYSILMKVREYLINKGLNIVAPCPHMGKCRLADDDWCHFSCRVARSKIHKVIKEADVPYEDEKFMYLAIRKTGVNNKPDNINRILRHPFVAKGQITLDICSAEGNKKTLYRKKDGLIYKKVKKLKWGDCFTED